MKNDSVRGGVKISIPPTLLFSALGWIEDASRAMDLTPGARESSSTCWARPRDELGGSELSTHLGQQGLATVPPCAAPRSAAARSAPPRRRPRRTGCSAPRTRRTRGAWRSRWPSSAWPADLGFEGALDGLAGGEALGTWPCSTLRSGARLLLWCRRARPPRWRIMLDEEQRPLGAGWAQMVRAAPCSACERGGHPILEQNVDALRCRFKETLDDL